MFAKKIIFEIIVFEGRRGIATGIDSVYVGQEQVSRFTNDGHIILNVQGHLKIILPVLPFVAIIWKDGIIEENFQAVEIGTETVKHDDIGSDQQEVRSELRIYFIEFVEVAPGDEE